jgi:uncharacterized protein (DUF1015 family)
MPNVKPFKAFHFNTSVVKDIASVAIPPYDVIKQEEADKYLSKSPYNFAHILLPKQSQEDYSGASKTIQDWFSKNIFVEEKTPGFYLYQQTFEYEGVRHRRNTLMCTVEISEYSQKQILPHENTYGQFKEDRLQILRKTKCNLSHVFGMVKDSEGFLQSLYEKVSFETPLIKTKTDDGIEQIVWKISEEDIAPIENFFKDKSLYILDGHHRFESSRLYAKEQKAMGDHKRPESQMLFAVVNGFDPALLVLPTHRALKKINSDFKMTDLEPYFSVETCEIKALKNFVKQADKQNRMGLYYAGGYYLLTPKSGSFSKIDASSSLSKLAVVWSDDLVLAELFKIPQAEKTSWISYEKEAETVLKDIKKYTAVIFHAPTPVEQVMEVADEGKFMPQKSTFFYPKLTAGLIMRRLS